MRNSLSWAWRVAWHMPLIVLTALVGVGLAYLERQSGRWVAAEARARARGLNADTES